MIWMLQDDSEVHTTHQKSEWTPVQGQFYTGDDVRYHSSNLNTNDNSPKPVTLFTDIPPSEKRDTDIDYTDSAEIEDTVITTIPPTKEPIIPVVVEDTIYATKASTPLRALSKSTKVSKTSNSVSTKVSTSSKSLSKSTKPLARSQSASLSSSSKRFTIDQLPITSTKYTYEHTNSFDSGISDFSNPHSPALDTSRGSLREVKTLFPSTSSGRMTTTAVNGHASGKVGDKKFLKKVQRELDDQRNKWEGEVDMLSDSFFSQASIPKEGKATQQGENSYVDTSSGTPIFKAFVDVSAYPRRGVSVSVDNVTNKVIVKANQENGLGNVTQTFTQKVSLPRFADEQRLTSHMSKKGILKIEVPLIYYFQRPPDAKERDRKAKSFVYQVEDKNGAKVLEILVNTGSEYRAKELKVLVQEDNKLVILGEKAVTDPTTGHRDVQQKLIKQYSLPGYADVDHISSKLGKDGRLQVNVPIMK